MTISTQCYELKNIWDIALYIYVYALNKVTFLLILSLLHGLGLIQAYFLSWSTNVFNIIIIIVSQYNRLHRRIKEMFEKAIVVSKFIFFLGIFLFYLVHGSQNMSNNKNNSSLYAISRLKPIFAVANASQIFLMLLLFVIQLKSNQMLKIN